MIVTPLSADGFDTLLRRYDLVSRYPNLSWNLRNGFPLGEFSHLHQSYIHPNHSNSDYVNNYILNYIQDEVAGSRMSGPFTLDQLKKEARGEVIVSPLGAVDKAGEPGKLRIIRDLSFKGKAPFSVNDRIDPNSYITKWHSAAMVMDLVSPFFLFFYSSAVLFYFYFSAVRSQPLHSGDCLCLLLHRQGPSLIRMIICVTITCSFLFCFVAEYISTAPSGAPIYFILQRYPSFPVLFPLLTLLYVRWLLLLPALKVPILILLPLIVLYLFSLTTAVIYAARLWAVTTWNMIDALPPKLYSLPS